MLLGGLFLRRSPWVLRILSTLVGALTAMLLCGVLGLAGFLARVDDRGGSQQIGVFQDGGCVQGEYRYDPFKLSQYTRLLVASTCADPQIPPGLEAFPAPGQVFVSPALASARATSKSLATRFPRVDGLISPEGLTDARQLYAIIGVRPFSGEQPVGVSTFNEFGSDGDYLASYLRFGRATLIVLGLFFTFLPAMYLMAACTRLNARTRERQLGLLSVLGVGSGPMRRALVLQSAVTAAVGASLGAAIAMAFLRRSTPTFVAWRAFPGDLSIEWTQAWLSWVVVTGAAALSAALGARSLARRTRDSPTTGSVPVGWRWSTLGLGVVIAGVSYVVGGRLVWPVVLLGRLATFVGLLLVVSPVCASLGRRLTRSDDPLTALVGARLLRPSGALTRSLAALVSGLFVLSAGTSTVATLGSDPSGIQRAYSADGRDVLEVRRPSASLRHLLDGFDVLSGTTDPDDPSVSGHLRGSCRTVQEVVGDDELTCSAGRLFLTPDGNGPPAKDSGFVTTDATGARPEVLAGFLVTISASAPIAPDADEVFVPLRTREAHRLYDEIVGSDATSNVRIAGSADVSGASELGGILDVFRWGAAVASTMSFLAVIVSLVILLRDRRPGDGYLQILGLGRARRSKLVTLEVLVALWVSVGLSLGVSVLWTPGSTAGPGTLGLFDVAVPFVATAGALSVLVLVMVGTSLGWTKAGRELDHDALVDLHDVFGSPQPRPRRRGRRIRFH